MNKRRPQSALWAATCCVAFLLTLAGCAPAATEQLSREDLEARIAQDPNDWAAHRDLGVLMAMEHNYPRAHQSLQRAFERQPEDPRTLYYLGLVNEVLGRPDTAIRLYEHFDTVPSTSEYREKIRGRYLWLLRRQARDEFRAALQREEELAPRAGDDALGVLPFNFRRGPARYEPLGRGLAELITVDLAAVEGLTVVERVRLQTLLGELELARSGAVDPETAPRYGRLLRANRLVGGHFGVADAHLTIDSGVFSAETPDELPELASASGTIDRLFDIQKEIVRALLDDLGVAPTPAQLARLDRVPTRDLNAFVNFSRGLQLEDREQYERAAGFYERAAQIDPNFSMAAQKAVECHAIASQTGEAADLLAGADAALGLLGLRSSRLNQTLSQHLIPSVDTRNPAAEGVVIGPELPEPPEPPGGND